MYKKKKYQNPFYNFLRNFLRGLFFKEINTFQQKCIKLLKWQWHLAYLLYLFI